MSFWRKDIREWIQVELQRAGYYADIEEHTEDVYTLYFSGADARNLDSVAADLKRSLSSYFAGNTYIELDVFVSDFEPNAIEVFVVG